MYFEIEFLKEESETFEKIVSLYDKNFISCLEIPASNNENIKYMVGILSGDGNDVALFQESLMEHLESVNIEETIGE